MTKYPCENCEKRFVGCHSSCQEYKVAKEANAVIVEAMKQEQKIRNEANAFVLENIEKTKKKAHRRR